jgi:hypothetical protein
MAVGNRLPAIAPGCDRGFFLRQIRRFSDDALLPLSLDCWFSAGYGMRRHCHAGDFVFSDDEVVSMLAFFSSRPVLLAFAIFTAALAVGLLIYFDIV